MTDNPFKTASETAKHKRSPQEWADRGNRVLLGQEANTKGEYETPRHDVHWVVRDGRCAIEWKCPSTPSTAGGR